MHTQLPEEKWCDVWMIELGGSKQCILKENTGSSARFETRAGYTGGAREGVCECSAFNKRTVSGHHELWSARWHAHVWALCSS